MKNKKLEEKLKKKESGEENREIEELKVKIKSLEM